MTAALLLAAMLFASSRQGIPIGGVPEGALGVCRVDIPPGRIYFNIPLEKMATTLRTHVCVEGPVVYRRKQKDGDWHVTLDNGKAKVVLEIIPAIPLPPPPKGSYVEACGISRFDKHHGWGEVHPVERLTVLRERRAL